MRPSFVRKGGIGNSWEKELETACVVRTEATESKTSNIETMDEKNYLFSWFAVENSSV